jgi:hypothetical protein
LLGVAVGCRLGSKGSLKKDGLEEAYELFSSRDRHPAGKGRKPEDQYPF